MPIPIPYNTAAAFLAQARADAERDMVAAAHMDEDQISYLNALGGEPDPVTDGVGCDHSAHDGFEDV